MVWHTLMLNPKHILRREMDGYGVREMVFPWTAIVSARLGEIKPDSI